MPGGSVTRQRTVILTRIESSDQGRQDVIARRSGGLRYGLLALLVPFWAYALTVDSVVRLIRMRH